MSLYRIATANSYENTLRNISARQNDVARSQDQLSSGKRVLRASDDAVAATLAERAQNRLARVEADLRALESSRTALTQAESALGEATEVMHRVRELLVQAGNPVLTASMRADLATQLVGLREQMLAVANRADTSGLTLFGGLGGAEKPFVDLYGPAPGVAFAGQAGQYAPTENSLPHAVDGSAAWMRVAQGNGTFTATLDPANPGQLHTTIGDFDIAQPLPGAFTAPTGQGYRIEFISATEFKVVDVEVEAAWTVLGDPVPEVTLDAPAVASGTDPATGGNIYTFASGQEIRFQGVSISLQGVPQAGDSVQLDSVLGVNGDIFQTIQNAVEALRYAGTNQAAHLTQEMARAIQETDNGMDTLLVARGRLGDWLNRADTMQQLFEDRGVFHEKEQSDLIDLDMVEGISEFQTNQLALDAALKSYAQVQRLSLFQYIG